MREISRCLLAPPRETAVTLAARRERHWKELTTKIVAAIASASIGMFQPARQHAPDRRQVYDS